MRIPELNELRACASRYVLVVASLLRRGPHVVAVCILSACVVAIFVTGGPALLLYVVAALAGAALTYAQFVAIDSKKNSSPATNSDTGTGIYRREMIYGALDQRLEQLHDSKWELSENATHYRELLDAQDGLIVRRNADSKLTFVNQAFCTAFGVSASDVLGRSFSIVVLDVNGIERRIGLPDCADGVACQNVITASGPRWIEWETHDLHGENVERESQLIGHDVTNQRIAASRIEEARVQAEAGSRAKSRFLAAMSHEIRTPMNGILGMTGLLRDTPLNAEQKSYCQAIEQSAETLLGLINEILDFSKIEAGKIALKKTVFDFEVCIQSATELLAPRAHQKGLQIAWSLDPNCPVSVIGDEMRVRQILLNLISNAIKFTDEGGVEICAQVATHRQANYAHGFAENRVQIEVRDTGVGMSPGDCNALFEEFEQADEAIGQQRGGTGLGLAIAKRLSRLMGGELMVASVEGQGSTFTLTLPLAEAFSNQSTTQSARTCLNSERAHRVLVASDREIERNVLARVLKDCSVDVVATRVCEAVDTIDEAMRCGGSFQAVVVDGCCDVENALHILERARGGGRRVGGYVCVDAFERRYLRQFREVGFSSHLVRPVRPSALRSHLLSRESRNTVGRYQPPLGPGDRQLRVGSNEADETKPVRHDLNLPHLILVAEDNPVNELLATRLIEKSGHTPVSVRTGIEAVDYMRRALAGEIRVPDLILMDIQMPDMDGVTATRQIRSLFARVNGAATRCPPIIALTANAFDEDRQRYLDAGLDGYLSKPFDGHELVATIRQWCEPELPADNTAHANAQGPKTM